MCTKEMIYCGARRGDVRDVLTEPGVHFVMCPSCFLRLFVSPPSTLWRGGSTLNAGDRDWINVSAQSSSRS